jgi:hypothetical protein
MFGIVCRKRITAIYSMRLHALGRMIVSKKPGGGNGSFKEVYGSKPKGLQTIPWERLQKIPRTRQSDVRDT